MDFLDSLLGLERLFRAVVPRFENPSGGNSGDLTNQLQKVVHHVMGGVRFVQQCHRFCQVKTISENRKGRGCNTAVEHTPCNQEVVG